ncbi:MAG: leucine-rich repeat domain-containing protein [Oscillospiraceae bacterium]|nr:leucine-rich repeat domain-containing protein [Oscillospiraceae bacterium]
MTYPEDAPVVTAERLEDLSTLYGLITQTYNKKLLPLFELRYNDLKSEFDCECIVISGGVENIPANTFRGFENIKEVILPKSLKTIGNYAFSSCTSLERISFPEGLKKIGTYSFANCVSLEKLTLPENIEEIGGAAFAWCNKLKEIDFASVKVINAKAFFECFALQSITFPESIELVDCDSFAGCKALTEINIPKKEFNIDGSFANGTPWLENYPDDFVIGGDNILIAYKGSADEVFIPDGIKSISCCAFEDARVRKVHIPDTVHDIGMAAFYFCSELEEINIPPLVTVIREGTFYKCRSLKEIVLPPSVTEVKFRAFRHCSSLENVVGAENLKKVGSVAFTYSPWADKHPEYEKE